MPRKFHLGNFIQVNHIAKSIELLTYQLEQTSPLYNNLDFSLYRNSGLEKIDPEKYYNEFVKRDSLYYFESLFFSEKYYSIQRAYKIREYHFLSLNALIIYYAIGFYILELLEKRLAIQQQLYSKKNIHIYYGGKLNFQTPTDSKIFYYEDYKDFLLHKEQLTKPEESKNVFVVSLDIKSFFYTVNHNILLDTIDKTATVSIKKALNYNDDTKEALLIILNYLQHNKLGLPVANQNIVSSFLSSVYFTTFDQYIIDNYLNDDKYHYIRYVDDFYLIFKESSDADQTQIRQRIYNIENDFSSFLINNLQLAISSSKSERYLISNIESQIEFLKASSIDSPFDLEFDLEDLYKNSVMNLDINGKKIPQIFEECIAIIEKIRAKSYELQQLDINTNDSAYLNHILILKACLSYSKSEDAIKLIEAKGIFKNLDSIDFLLLKPKVFFHLITLTRESRADFFKFIVNNFTSTDSLLPKLTIVDKFIHQMFFIISEIKIEKQTELIEEFEEYKRKLLDILFDFKENIPKNTYLDLILNTINPNPVKLYFEPIYESKFLNENISLVQQIKLRRLNEIGFNHSVSFNHLLNEFQNLFELTYFNTEQKTAKDIIQKMAEENYKGEEITFVTNFFERRNQNSISHANTDDIGIWAVTQAEYEYYKIKREPLLSKIYKKLLNN